MSGGSFDYLYESTNPREALSRLDDIKKMYESMREMGKHDAADEMEKLHLDFEMFYRMIENRMERLSDVMYAYEWWTSGDHSEKDFDEVWKSFLEGKQ